MQAITLKDIADRLDTLTSAVLSNKTVLTIDEAAALTGLSVSSIYKLTSNQEIPHFKPRGKMLYFNRAELESWLMQLRVKTTEEINAAAAKHVSGARVATWKRVIEVNGTKQNVNIENALLIPLFGESGKILSLQAIFPVKHPLFERNKDFMPRGCRAGSFWWIGAKTKTVLICERFATAATLHEQTGNRVYMAFAANNLLSVARIVWEKLPNADIVLAADNDTETAGNPGLTKASEAAAAIGGAVWFHHCRMPTSTIIKLF